MNVHPKVNSAIATRDVIHGRSAMVDASRDRGVRVKLAELRAAQTSCAYPQSDKTQARHGGERREAQRPEVQRSEGQRSE